MVYTKYNCNYPYSSPNSVLLGVLNAFLRCPPWCWMVCPPSRGLLPPCLPLSPIVSHCLPTSVPVLDGVSACLLLSPIVSPHACLCWMVCPPSQGLVLSCLVSRCLPLSPHMRACVRWCVRLPEVLSPLVSPCLPLSPNVSLHMCLCWIVSLPRSCLPLSVSDCLPLSPRMCACVGWCVRLPEVLSPLVSACPPACLPTCLPSCLPACLPACLASCFLCWMVCAWIECLDPNTCTPIGCVLHRSSASSVATKQAKPEENVKRSPALIADIFTLPVTAISCVWPCSSKHFLNTPTVWGLRWCIFFHGVYKTTYPMLPKDRFTKSVVTKDRFD